jgi:hypothetical protein
MDEAKAAEYAVALQLTEPLDGASWRSAAEGAGNGSPRPDPLSPFLNAVRNACATAARNGGSDSTRDLLDLVDLLAAVLGRFSTIQSLASAPLTTLLRVGLEAVQAAERRKIECFFLIETVIALSASRLQDAESCESPVVSSFLHIMTQLVGECKDTPASTSAMDTSGDGSVNGGGMAPDGPSDAGNIDIDPDSFAELAEQLDDHLRHALTESNAGRPHGFYVSNDACARLTNGDEEPSMRSLACSIVSGHVLEVIDFVGGQCANLATLLRDKDKDNTVINTDRTFEVAQRLLGTVIMCCEDGKSFVVGHSVVRTIADQSNNGPINDSDAAEQVSSATALFVTPGGQGGVREVTELTAFLEPAIALVEACSNRISNAGNQAEGQDNTNTLESDVIRLVMQLCTAASCLDGRVGLSKALAHGKLLAFLVTKITPTASHGEFL